MAQKKEMKVRDLKPSKDAKGGAHRNIDSSTQRSRSSDSAQRGKAGSSRNLAGRTLQ